MEKQMEALRQTMGHLKFKCWRHDTALAAGSAQGMKGLTDEDIPEELRDYRL